MWPTVVQNPFMAVAPFDRPSYPPQPNIVAHAAGWPQGGMGGTEEWGRRGFASRPHYVIVGTLGQGTYGQVVLVENVFTARCAAIKVSRPEAAYRDAARREAHLLSQLSTRTPYVVQVWDFFEEPNATCIAMEILSTHLTDLLWPPSEEGGGASLAVVRGCMVHLLSALAHLHSLGFAHGDVKPENIMMRTTTPPLSRGTAHRWDGGAESREKSGRGECAGSREYLRKKGIAAPRGPPAPAPLGVAAASTPWSTVGGSDVEKKWGGGLQLCLLDFGAARSLSEPPYFDVQSLPYRAPEVMAGMRYGVAIDVWSAGVVFAELLLGRRLFGATNVAEQWAAVHRWTAAGGAAAQIPRRPSHATTAWRDAVALIDAMMAMDPAERITAVEALGHPFLAHGTMAMRAPFHLKKQRENVFSPRPPSLSLSPE